MKKPAVVPPLSPSDNTPSAQKENPQPENPAPENPDSFPDLSALRLSQNFLETGGAKKILTTVPVRKPRPQDFVRVHPDAAYREPFAIIELKDDREHYLVTAPIAAALPSEIVTVMLYTTINRQRVVALWPVRLPASDGRVLEWHRSAQEAAEHAMQDWIRIKSNMSLGAYEITKARPGLSDPEWPTEYSFHDLLKIAFRDRIVRSFDHPVLKRLRGEC
jgi:hypothetical protein